VDRYGFHKNHVGTRYAKSVGHIVHFGASEVRNVEAQIFMLGWDRYRFQKNHVETRYAEPVFLYPVGPTCPKVCFSASGVRNVKALFFMLQWDRYGFQKNHVRTRYTKGVFLHPRGSAGPVVHLGVSRVRNVDAIFFMLGWDRYGFHKNHVEIRYAELVSLASCGPYRSRSVVWCIWGAKCRRTIFHARVGPVRIPQKIAPGDITPNLCVYMQWDQRVT
jgi:hypothetical protein